MSACASRGAGAGQGGRGEDESATELTPEVHDAAAVLVRRAARVRVAPVVALAGAAAVEVAREVVGAVRAGVAVDGVVLVPEHEHGHGHGLEDLLPGVGGVDEHERVQRARAVQRRVLQRDARAKPAPDLRGNMGVVKGGGGKGKKDGGREGEKEGGREEGGREDEGGVSEAGGRAAGRGKHGRATGQLASHRIASPRIASRRHAPAKGAAPS